MLCVLEMSTKKLYYAPNLPIVLFLFLRNAPILSYIELQNNNVHERIKVNATFLKLNDYVPEGSLSIQ